MALVHHVLVMICMVIYGDLASREPKTAEVSDLSAETESVEEVKEIAEADHPVPCDLPELMLWTSLNPKVILNSLKSS